MVRYLYVATKIKVCLYMLFNYNSVYTVINATATIVAIVAISRAIMCRSHRADSIIFALTAPFEYNLQLQYIPLAEL
jgi:hypothetical protein